jgi:hypothetical protein
VAAPPGGRQRVQEKRASSSGKARGGRDRGGGGRGFESFGGRIGMSRQKGSVRAEQEPRALTPFFLFSFFLFSFRDGDYSDSWAEHERENGQSP